MLRTAAAALAVLLAACPAPVPTPDDDGNGGGPPSTGGGRGDGGTAAADAGTGSCLPSAKFPVGRGDLAGGADPSLGLAVFFGGDVGIQVSCTPQPAFSGETWLFDVACSSWKQIAGGPSPRARQASAFDSKRHRMIFFGGRFRAGTSGIYTVYDETWAFDFTTSKWSRLAPTGAIPAGRANASLVYDAQGDRVLLFGGNVSSNGAFFDPQNTVHSLDFNTNTWTELLVNGAARPPARLFHGAAIDEKRHRMIIAGGGDANAFQGPFLGDVWALDLSAGIWTEQKPAGPAPDRRIRAALVADPLRDRLLLFGGHDDVNGGLGERNDLWALDLAQGRWVSLRAGDKLKNATPIGTCSFPPDFTTPDLDSPERRDAHALVSLGNGGFLLFAGKADCGNLQDVWTLDAAKAAWTRDLPSTTGESCLRSGKQQCSTLCN